MKYTVTLALALAVAGPTLGQSAKDELDRELDRIQREMDDVKRKLENLTESGSETESQAELSNAFSTTFGEP